MRSCWPLLLGLVSCGAPAPHQPLYAAGTDRDDGAGLLARASSTLMTDEETTALPARTSTPRRYEDRYGGEAYGGDAYGGSPYGGATYATYAPPPWGYPSVNRMPHYQQQAGLTAAIEGTIAWRGAVPKVTSSCGTIDPIAVGAERGVGGALVFIEKFTVGRVLPSAMGDQRPSLVGGVVVKRGCVLAPTMQVVNPLPAQLAIHGDATRTRIAITVPGTVAKPIELQEAGRVALQLKAGVTRIEAEDGSLGAAWVVGIDTPYFAVTDDAGRFRIDELAPGTYDVTILRPPVPTTVAGKLVYAAPVAMHRSVRVDAAKTARLDVSLGR